MGERYRLAPGARRALAAAADAVNQANGAAAARMLATRARLDALTGRPGPVPRRRP